MVGTTGNSMHQSPGGGSARSSFMPSAGNRSGHNDMVTTKFADDMAEAVFKFNAMSHADKCAEALRNPDIVQLLNPSFAAGFEI